MYEVFSEDCQRGDKLIKKQVHIRHKETQEKKFRVQPLGCRLELQTSKLKLEL